jgi:peptidoglycan/xylan/chitin deacetylase (PgdA/CDA1 family)
VKIRRFDRYLGRKGRPLRELILNFHGLGEPHDLVDALEARYWWRADSFARLLDRLVDYPINASPKISITFDDGNASDCLVALPELSKRQLQASFFVCAGRIGMKNYLDSSMIKELLSAGMNIGSHGMDHLDWRTLNSERLEVEIVEARKRIEDAGQTPVKIVAIPFGAYNGRILKRLNRESWDCIYTSDRGSARVTDKVKPRETLLAAMQDGDILSELLSRPQLKTNIVRALRQGYKRL